MAKLLGFPVRWRILRTRPRVAPPAAPPAGFNPRLASHQLMFF